MSRPLRFVIGLVIGLGLVAWIASVIVNRTTTAWFEKDISLRAQLIVSSARQSLVAHWSKEERGKLKNILADITRDERVMAAAACKADRTLLMRTTSFPDEIECKKIADQVQSMSNSSAGMPKAWHSLIDLPSGKVHVSAIPLSNRDALLGFVILVHDWSYVERRDNMVRIFLFIAFGFSALVASAMTILIARWSWRGWSNELRSFLRGHTDHPHFRPFIKDVRELVDRIFEEREIEREGGPWTPARLKQALNRYLHRERVVIIANREPYIHERTSDGKINVVHPASGLVTALEPVMRACSGVWVAHGSGSADRDVVDTRDRIRVPPGEESYFLRRVWLSAEEERGYYYGFSNEGLWPLCHLAHARPLFRSEDWNYYKAVNRKFAEAVCSEVDSDDPIILVQDYHFALAPALIRERLPRSTIITFWHIPWPNSERFGICPWRHELLTGMLGSSIIGFHTRSHCNNFLESIDQFLESRIDRELNAVVRQGRPTLIRPYPISIEWPPRWLASSPSPAECRKSVIEELGLGKDVLIGVGVDRVDYTKGVEERLLTVEKLLDRYPAYRGHFTFVQVAAPSRTVIEKYQQLNETIEQLTRRVNEKYGNGTYRPIVLLHHHHEPSAVFRYYRAADVCYVSSLHDGMNLVAKEFVAARDDERGVLVLSQFTGAARELTEALIVNPYDLDEASAALATALQMSVEEQKDRMRSMRSLLAEFNVYRWAGRMIVDAARLRRRDRLTGRLTERFLPATDQLES